MRMQAEKRRNPKAGESASGFLDQNHYQEKTMANSTEACAARAITVPFHGADLCVVEHDGQPFTPMKALVTSMGLNWSGQFEKVKENESRWGIRNIRIPSEGGIQEAIGLPLRKLPGWMATLEPKKMKSVEAAARVLVYQNECDDVLWQYWNDGLAINPRATRPHNPAIDYDRISPAQAQDLKELVHSVVDAKVQGFAETWARLHKKFRVNSYLELPATRFEEARDYLLGKLPQRSAYHFPLAMADVHDRQFANTWFTPERLTDPKNPAPELDLIQALERDGHDVTGAKVRILAMRDAMDQMIEMRQGLQTAHSLARKLENIVAIAGEMRGKNVLFAGNLAAVQRRLS